MNVSELKPCPFCGGAPRKERSSGDERDGYADRVSYVCTSCGCRRGASGDSSKGGYADNSKVEEAALAKWNTRVEAATTCPGHGRSECVSCCWPKGDTVAWNGSGLPPVGLRVEAYFPQDTQPVWLETTLLYVSDENVIYDDEGDEIRKTRAQFDDLNVQFRKVQS